MGNNIHMEFKENIYKIIIIEALLLIDRKCLLISLLSEVLTNVKRATQNYS